MITEILAILYLVIVTFGFGISLNYFFKFTNAFTEFVYKVFSLLVIGFGFFVLSIFLLGMIRIPMYYPIFLIISLIIPFILLITYYKTSYYKQIRLPNINIQQLAVLVIVMAFFSMMIYGAFSYNWLEDDDPYSYAEGAKYVAQMHTYHSDSSLQSYNTYLFPHSHCTLTTIFGILNQFSHNMIFLMKFFICFALLMGIIGFFLFVYDFTQQHRFAIVATAILAITPCFAGHFIFNYTLSVCLFCIFLFTLSLSFSNKKYTILSGMILGSVLITHPIAGIQAAVVMFIMLIFYFVYDIVINRLLLTKSNVLRIILVGLLGILFAMPFYGDLVVSGQFDSFYDRAFRSGIVKMSTGNYYDTKDYVLNDFIIAPMQSNMDQQMGVGIFLFTICIIGLMIMIWYTKFNNMMLYTILFLFYLFFLWIMTGSSWGISVQNYRWWSFFAIFIVLLATSTIFFVCSKIQESNILLCIFLVIVCIGLVITSAYPRFAVQTSQWPPGSNWLNQNQLDSYVKLQELGYDNQILPICGRPEKINAFNQITPTWQYPTQEYFRRISNSSEMNSTQIMDNIHWILDGNYDYKYVLIDIECVKRLGINNTVEVVNYFNTDNYDDINVWRVVDKYSNNEFILYRRNY